MGDGGNQKDEEQSPDAGRPFQLAQLAAIMMSGRLGASGLGTQGGDKKILPQDVSDPRWNDEFSGALKRADMLLRRLEERDVEVKAYQIFEEGLELSEERMAYVFKDICWPGLSAKASVGKLMDELRRLAGEFLERRYNKLATLSDDARLAWDEVKEAIHHTGSLDYVKNTFPGFDGIATNFLKALRDNQVTPSPFESVLDADWYDRFFEWCFPFQKKDGKIVRKYRPHEIFLFAANQGWCPEKLIGKLSDLKSDFVPFPERNLYSEEFRLFKENYDADFQNMPRAMEGIAFARSADPEN